MMIRSLPLIASLWVAHSFVPSRVPPPTPGRRARAAPRARLGMALDPTLDAALDRLCAAQPAWSRDAADRADAARAVLRALARDRWSRAGGWVGAQLALEGLDATSAAGAGAGATYRYVLGSMVKEYLTTHLAAAEGRGAPPPLRTRAAADGRRAAKAFGPFALGPGAPGVEAELWCDDDDDPADAEGARAGTCCLVLGAGNQSFLSLVDLLDRVFGRGEAVLLKHHPLRPWLDAPYADILTLKLPQP